jgi:Staphylococcal nuclease homologue
LSFARSSSILRTSFARSACAFAEKRSTPEVSTSRPAVSRTTPSVRLVSARHLCFQQRHSVVNPHFGHNVENLELVRRGLAWRDYFDAQAQPDREQYQAALSEAQRARQGLWSQDRVEAPRDFRARVSQHMRWWLYAVAGLAGFTLLGLVFSVYDKQISAWIERQDQITKESAEAYRQAHMQAEAEQEERDRTREIADQEMDRLAAERRRRKPM